MADALNLLVTYSGNQEQSKWHGLRKVVERLSFGLIQVVFLLQLLSTLCYATKYKAELMEKLVEDLVVFQTYDLINLVNLMKRNFSTVDPVVVTACAKEEKKWYLMFAALTASAFSLAVAEVHLVPAEGRDQMRAEMYGYKYPNNKVPINYYTPPFLNLDISAPPLYYIYSTLMPCAAFVLLVSACLTYTLLGVFSIHIKGQYDILLKYFTMIQKPDRDKWGHIKFYVNIVTGDYFICSNDPTKIVLYTRASPSQADNYRTVIGNMLSRTDQWTNCHWIRDTHLRKHMRRAIEKELCSPLYDEFFLKQIIRHHQFLLQYRIKVQSFMTPMAASTCLLIVGLIGLDTQIVLTSEYKLTYFFCLILVALQIMKLVSFSESLEYKLTYFFCLILVALQIMKLVSFSESLEDCNRQFQRMVYTCSDWPFKSRSIRTLVQIVIQRTNKSEHFSFHGGVITYDRPLLLMLFTTTYRFLNWLVLVSKKEETLKSLV
ncbi:hypothetical protein M8J76_005347 [Diaphorina citri]|nr:hypothetical protein M8J76_005347 [Diaphorina citri]